MDVVGFGALNVDLIYEVDLPLLGIEAGKERIGKYEEFENLLKYLNNKGNIKMRSGGGSAANTVYALSKMGFSCGYIGKVGKDKEGEFLLEGLRREGVDTSKILQNEKSGLCIVLLDKRKDRSILILPNANDSLSYSEIDIDYINKAKFLHITSLLGETPFEAQKIIAQKTKAKISFDPGEPHVKRGIEELKPIFKRSFIIFPSQEEVKMLTGKDYKNGAREMLNNYGIKIVACTRGNKGSYILSKEEEIELLSEEAEVVDTMGAGDVYAAGFLAGLLKGYTLFKCAKLATKAAAQSIKDYGRKSYPDKEILS
ncbi:carbohydrate kinase family protein [Candidatus Aerophobetes bacterium]|nr:carbohydrate kinase family protein [Candidatus Aerophobetes bacterium]